MASKYVVQRTSTVDAAVDDAFGIVEDLKGQMEEWRDNMDGANMSHLPKYEEVSEAYDGLENIENEKPECPEFLAQLAATYIELLPKPRRPLSRAKQGQNASSMLDAAAAAVRQWLDENDAKEIEGDEEREELEAQISEAEEFADAVENARDELDNVNFPGMY